jgi:hypothetical protein
VATSFEFPTWLKLFSDECPWLASWPSIFTTHLKFSTNSIKLSATPSFIHKSGLLIHLFPLHRSGWLTHLFPQIWSFHQSAAAGLKPINQTHLQNFT